MDRTTTLPHIQVIDVSKSFDDGSERLTALDGVSLNVAHGEFVTLLGPSGCGKTTLLRLIGGLTEPTSGETRIAGRTPAEAQASKDLGFVFQEPSLLPWRTVSRNVRLPLEVNRQNSASNHSEVDDLLRLVGLERYAGYYPNQLSGGMLQRVALARALAVGASLLLMDEPFGALDEITRESMRYELLRVWEADRKTVVFVTHSIAEAVTLSDRVVMLSSQPGRVSGVIHVDLPRPRRRSMEREPEFLRYSGLLHDLLVQGNRAQRAGVG